LVWCSNIGLCFLTAMSTVYIIEIPREKETCKEYIMWNTISVLLNAISQALCTHALLAVLRYHCTKLIMFEWILIIIALVYRYRVAAYRYTRMAFWVIETIIIMNGYSNQSRNPERYINRCKKLRWLSMKTRISEFHSFEECNKGIERARNKPRVPSDNSVSGHFTAKQKVMNYGEEFEKRKRWSYKAMPEIIWIVPFSPFVMIVTN